MTSAQLHFKGLQKELPMSSMNYYRYPLSVKKESTPLV